MLKQKFHINQPDVTYTPRPGVPVARQPVAISADIPVTDLDWDATRIDVLRPTGTVTLAPGISTTVNPQVAVGKVGKPIFRTALHAGARTMIISDTRGLQDYREFPSRFAARYASVRPVPGLEVIGCGYNIFGLYAEASSLKRRLFDVDKMPGLEQTRIGNTSYNHWPIVTVHGLSSSKRQTIVGETATKYAESLSISTGLEAGFLGFHAQTEMDFNTSTTRNMYHAFTNVMDTTQVFALHLEDRNDLRTYLTDEALNAIDNPDGQWLPDRLFDEFGLYFLTGAVMGGRLNHWSYVDTFYLASNTDLRAMAEADFRDIVGGQTGVQSSSSFATYQKHSVSETATLGGDPTIGGRSIVDQSSYQRWKDSIANNPGFLDFTIPSTKKPLTPIWTLATGTRRVELEARASEYENNITRQFMGEHAIDPSRKTVTYVVKTYTGSADGAGTDAGIWVVLYGVDRLGNAHETRQLKHDDSRDNHNKNAVDSIEFAGLLDVGELTKIKVIHDGRGENRGSSWQLKKIEVLCPENGRLYKANYNGWLNRNAGVFDLYL